MKEENKNTALLVMDVQPNIVNRIEEREAYIKKVETTVSIAHKNKIPVIYIVVGFRAGFPEVAIRNKMFSEILKRGSSGELVEPRPVIEPI